MDLGGCCPLVDEPKRRAEYVHFEGEPATRIWFIKRGSAVLTRASKPGSVKVPVAIRIAGSFLGIEALVRDTYLDTARITSDAILCSASLDVASAWLCEGAAARLALEQVLRDVVGDAARLHSAAG